MKNKIYNRKWIIFFVKSYAENDNRKYLDDFCIARKNAYLQSIYKIKANHSNTEKLPKHDLSFIQ